LARGDTVVAFGNLPGDPLHVQLMGQSRDDYCRRPAPTASSSGPCGSYLSPADFASVGVTGAGEPRDNSQLPSQPGSGQSHYCVYAGTSSAQGGIEFDWFTGDGPTIYQTILGEGGATTPLTVPGADRAALQHPGSAASAVVLKGNLAFGIGIPDSPQARTQLVTLSQIVIARDPH
jgi:hypothetical protein